MKIAIQFDGGCRPTNPGNKYGSYCCSIGGTLLLKNSRIEFGEGTNNEAEFESLHAALADTLKDITSGGLDPRSFEVEMLTDSKVVISRIGGKNISCKTEPQQRMFALAGKCLELLFRFGSYKIEWQPRENNVSLFGH